MANQNQTFKNNSKMKLITFFTSTILSLHSIAQTPTTNLNKVEFGGSKLLILRIQVFAVSLTSVHTSRYTTLRLTKLRVVTPALQGLSPVGVLLLKELYLTFEAHTPHCQNIIFLLFLFLYFGKKIMLR